MGEPDSEVDRLIRSLAGAPTLPELPAVVDVRKTAPPNPPEAIQSRFVGASYVQAYSEAASFVRVAEEWSAKYLGRGLAGSKCIVDFGSGWGRISRLLLGHVAPQNLYAIDVDLDMTALVNSTLPGVNTMTVNPMPPSVLRDGVTDTVVAFSVFSHLSGEAHEAWAHEFGRLTAAPGMIFLTLLDEAFFDQVAGAKKARAEGSVEPMASALAVCFDDLDDARAAFRHGKPAYAAVGGGGVLSGDFYGWAVIPSAFIKRVWGDSGFEIVEWVPSGTLFPQAMVGLIKRPRSHRISSRLPRISRGSG
jgi:hypothetical protein